MSVVSFRAPHVIIGRFTRPYWLPLEVVIKLIDDDSMEGSIMPAIVQHINMAMIRIMSRS